MVLWLSLSLFSGPLPVWAMECFMAFPAPVMNLGLPGQCNGFMAFFAPIIDVGLPGLCNHFMVFPFPSMDIGPLEQYFW